MSWGTYALLRQAPCGNFFTWFNTGFWITQAHSESRSTMRSGIHAAVEPWMVVGETVGAKIQEAIQSPRGQVPADVKMTKSTWDLQSGCRKLFLGSTVFAVLCQVSSSRGGLLLIQAVTENGWTYRGRGQGQVHSISVSASAEPSPDTSTPQMQLLPLHCCLQHGRRHFPSNPAQNHPSNGFWEGRFHLTKPRCFWKTKYSTIVHLSSTCDTCVTIFNFQIRM